MIESSRRTGDVLAWVVLALAIASLVLRLSGVSAVTGVEARMREILTPVGLVLFGLSLLARRRSGRVANGLFWLSMVMLLAAVVLLMRAVFAG